MDGSNAAYEIVVCENALIVFLGMPVVFFRMYVVLYVGLDVSSLLYEASKCQLQLSPRAFEVK